MHAFSYVSRNLLSKYIYFIFIELVAGILPKIYIVWKFFIKTKLVKKCLFLKS